MKIFVLSLLLFAFSPTMFGQAKNTRTVKIYLSDTNNNPNFEDCGKVRAVNRTILKTKTVAKAALEELFKGAAKKEKAKGLTSIFSQETSSILKNVNIKNGAAYVNLKDWVVQNLGTATTSCGAFTFVTPIEKTLMQFPTVKKVFFAIEGSPKDYYDWMQVGECPDELVNCSGKDFK